MELNGGLHPHELVEKALEGVINPAEEALLGEHLKTCPDCTAELEFARRTRSLLSASVVPAPGGAAINGMLARIEARMLNGDIQPSRIPALAGAMAVSLVLAWITASPGQLTRWMASRPAVELSISSVGLPQAELQEAMRFCKLAGPVDGFMRSTLMAVQLADFESPAELAGISVIGGGNFRLVDDAVSGRRSFLVEPGASGRDLVELLLPARPMDPAVVPVAVSVWVKSTNKSAVALFVRTPGGEIREGAVIRKAKAGQWVWAFLPLPAPRPDERGLAGDLGIRVSGGGSVSLDHVELWCRGGGGG